jgi:hypothetical protein
MMLTRIRLQRPTGIVEERALLAELKAEYEPEAAGTH